MFLAEIIISLHLTKLFFSFYFKKIVVIQEAFYVKLSRDFYWKHKRSSIMEIIGINTVTLSIPRVFQTFIVITYTTARRSRVLIFALPVQFQMYLVIYRR